MPAGLGVRITTRKGNAMSAPKIDTIEPIDYAAYGSLLTLMAALGSTAMLFTDAIEAGDRVTLNGCRMIYEMLITATTAIPEYGKSTDARAQFLSWITNYRDYAAAIASGKGDRQAIFREINEGQLVLGLAFDRLGRRLGFGSRE